MLAITQPLHLDHPQRYEKLIRLGIALFVVVVFFFLETALVI
jgi:hypothetical protein